VNTDPSLFPNGELRGPLVRPGETVSFAYLRGTSVVPAPMGGASSATGQIAFIVNVAASTARYDGTLFNLTPSGSGWGSLRIYRAKENEAVPLFTAPIITLQSVTSTSLSGDITGQSYAFYYGLAGNPQSPPPRGDYSVDVLQTSSTQFPNGTIRGAALAP
jgi:hypothetical protein